MANSGPSSSTRLLALGAAAVIAAYGTGYARTSDAASALAQKSTGRRRAPLPEESTPRVVMTQESEAVITEPARSDATPSTRSRPTVTAPPVPTTVDSETAEVPIDTVATAPVTKPTATLSPAQVPAAPAPSVPVALPPATPTHASAPSATPTEAPLPPGVKWHDGTFTGWGTSRHGDIEATVIIEKGRITAAAISRCLTRYSCSWIAHLQPQVVERQSADVDNVSGATESANAFYYAVLEALKVAKP